MKDYSTITIPIVLIGTGVVLFLAWTQRGKPANLPPSTGVGFTTPVHPEASLASGAAADMADDALAAALA
jgi:hypothetical protein